MSATVPLQDGQLQFAAGAGAATSAASVGVV